MTSSKKFIPIYNQCFLSFTRIELSENTQKGDDTQDQIEAKSCCKCKNRATKTIELTSYNIILHETLLEYVFVEDKEDLLERGIPVRYYCDKHYNKIIKRKKLKIGI